MKEKILIAGGSGLVGQALIKKLRDHYDISVMSRSAQKVDGIQYHAWDLNALSMTTEAIQVDYIINLTGAGIADKRWTNKRKKELIDSRVNSNKTLVKALKASGHRVKAILSASATGFYGNGGDKEFVETTPSLQNDFMSDCCIQWENSSEELSAFCERLCIVRLGIVMTTNGGALPKMKMPVHFGVAPYFYPGNQFYSWIHMDDLVKAFETMVENRDYDGVYNAISPQAATNKSFNQALQSVIRFPSILFPVPSFIIRLVFGEMADTILNSTRVSPKRLVDQGFKFDYPDLKEALKDIITRKI